jgi:uncharacterized membrane protein YphA (DoxX/SURF4 family)
MSRGNVRVRLQIVVRITLAVIFIYAALMKALHGGAGHTSSTIFTEWARSNFVRYVAIGVELSLAGWLVTGVRVGLASILATAILSAFTGLVIFEFEAERPKPCGCTGNQMVGADIGTVRSSLRFDLARNVLMMGGAGWLYISAKARGNAAPSARQSSPSSATVHSIHLTIA